jgi:hypothetical protein
MATDNQCPEYLAEREYVRKWLKATPDGRMAESILLRSSSKKKMQAVFDDEDMTDWEELVKEYRGSTVLAANCQEARGAFDLARQSRSTLGPPGASKGRWRNFLSLPLGYVLRRQIETCDPDYWNDPKNVYREALQFPEFCKVPPEVIRGKLEAILPKGAVQPLRRYGEAVLQVVP